MAEMSSLFVSLGAWNWLILAGVLFVLELLAPGIFLIWFGIAAAIVGVISLTIGIGWQGQLILFAVLAAVAVVVGRRYFRHTPDDSDHPRLNERGEQLVGRSFVLVESIENGRGKVRVGDSLWNVDGPDLPKGARVTVTGTDGSSLKVSAA